MQTLFCYFKSWQLKPVAQNRQTIETSFHRKIECKNVSCDQGLNNNPLYYKGF
jgi:hypothetical protein